MSNVKPGMLARVVRPKGHPMVTPELLGHIVFVECHYTNDMVFPTLEGRPLIGPLHGDTIWVVSSNTPLPTRVKRGFLVHSYKRPVADECLRPLLDPNLGVSDEEVKELYSTKEKECLVSQ